MTDIPDNVDLRWIARTLVSLRDEMASLRDDVRDLKQEVRRIREDLDVLTMRVIRVDANQTALRDDMRRLFEIHRELRGRVEGIENPPR